MTDKKDIEITIHSDYDQIREPAMRILEKLRITLSTYETDWLSTKVYMYLLRRVDTDTRIHLDNGFPLKEVKAKVTKDFD